MTPLTSRAFPVLAALLLGQAGIAGCKQTARDSKPSASSGASSPAGAALDPKQPVAKIGTSTITSGELDTKIKGRLSRMEAEHAEQVHGLKTQTLNEMIEQRLIDDKAKAEGLTGDKLIAREVEGKVPEPPAAEVQQVYDQTKASGRPLPPFDQVKVEIVKFLKQRKLGEAKQAYVDKLKAEAKVETMLPPLLMPKVQVAAEGPSKGEASAPVTIIEFSDFECPYCVKAEEAVNKVMEVYKGKVRLVYRDYPLDFHAKAQKASEAALCAGDQGKYWEMHAKLFANQKALEVPQLKQHAKEVGVEAGKFDKCLDGGDKAKDVAAHKKAGEEAGVTGTPAFFINGRPLTGAQPFEKFKEIIDHELSLNAK
jgi:protein-disulfide isomerase